MNKVLITGASSGIGREVASRLAGRGLTLALTGRSLGKLEALGLEADLIPADLTAPGSAAAVVEKSVAAMGGLDAVIHCAGVGFIKPLTETTDQDFTRILNVNTRATFLLAKEACAVMAASKKGLFVTIPGILGKAPMRNASAYVASKYAVTGFIKCLAQEYQRSGIRFSLLHLGGVDTPFWDDISMAVQRDKMIPVSTAADLVLQAFDAPSHLVLSEIVMQPESHQLV